jgi:hypothetical protein
LSHAEIVLFKAPLAGEAAVTGITPEYYDYVSTLKYNNVDKYVDRANIRVISVPDTCHENILTQEKIITSGIMGLCNT